MPGILLSRDRPTIAAVRTAARVPKAEARWCWRLTGGTLLIFVLFALLVRLAAQRQLTPLGQEIGPGDEAATRLSETRDESVLLVMEDDAPQDRRILRQAADRRGRGRRGGQSANMDARQRALARATKLWVTRVKEPVTVPRDLPKP